MADRTVDVVDAEGKKAGSVELPAEIFDVQTNVPLIHQVVVAQLAAARQGTHSTKTPRRGLAVAAASRTSRRAPVAPVRARPVRRSSTGGGIVHGPQPRDYSQRTPKKMKAAALRGALSDRARADRVHVVESFATGDAPSTKAAAALLAGLSRPQERARRRSSATTTWSR